MPKQNKQVNTIIILRNNSTTAWASSSHIMRKGELGVGYLYEDDGVTIKNIIVKAGDGINTWDDLHQVEGVFENDITLTYNFGKYKTVNGYVNTGGKGLTTSQWLIEALREVKNPEIVQPKYTLTPGTITTDTGTLEIGSKVTKIAWSGSFNGGSYEFGSKEGDQVYSKEDGTGVSVTHIVTGTHDGTAAYTNNSLGGTWTFKTPVAIINDTGTSLGGLVGTGIWEKSTRIPTNNIGETLEGEEIQKGSAESVITFSTTGYREGFFYGTSESRLAPGQVNSATIRALSKTGKKYAKGTKTFTIPSKAASVILAWDASKTGVTDILNTTVNAGMNDVFDLANPHSVKVGGADASGANIGNYPADYKFVIFTPAEAYQNTAELRITLG